jgi:hypothetical protein
MAQFATVDEFATRLGADLTEAEETDAAVLLTLASAAIQDAAGQAIEKVTNDTLSLRGTVAGRLMLPERPVLSVASVVLDGETLTVDEAYYLDGDELVRMPGAYSAGFPGSSRYGFGDADQTLVITYTHGYDPIPGFIKAICLEMAVRVWVNPGLVQQEGYGSEQVTYQATGGLVLTEAEERAVRRALRHTARSIRLR